jgi:hypothetical protein
MNETATRANSDKKLANLCSLDVLARHLTRLRPEYGFGFRIWGQRPPEIGQHLFGYLTAEIGR